MRVLVVGSGGREHALCWKLSSSPLLGQLWCAPGNPGTARVATNIGIDALNIPALVSFARENAIDLVIPGPEAPLVAGLADAMQAAAIACCGPSAAAARLEGSKSFAKEIADAAGIPTALWERFDDAEAARAFVRRRGAPVVVKADGLAAGKGVVVAASEADALAAIDAIMTERVFGDAGAAVVLEECLVGEEVSVFALCDGETAVPLGIAQDHKRAGEGDTGPNTGGMGAYTPPPAFGQELQDRTMEGFVRPALAEMARRGTPFRGVLFVGLMLTHEGPKLIEFNVRFGDPECQALLLRLRSDLLSALQAACAGELERVAPDWSDGSAVAVVLAVRGYPGRPERGSRIGDLARAETVQGARIFHSGTDVTPDGQLIASGGRVLTVCGTGADLAAARRSAYAAIGAIEWPQGFYRRDIGGRALRAT
ncbi:MAG: phosphoribosylamine--glycine ligase [Acetobacteraceae bacterium]|nr:phosphoribosylamine--glycine ligase [Acetobacteraceae bacterium]